MSPTTTLTPPPAPSPGRQAPDGAASGPTSGYGTAPASSMRPSVREVWIGRVLSALAVLFLIFDAGVKLLRLPLAVEGTTKLGYPADVIFTIGVIQVVCLIVYLVPRTSVFGAVLWTGYLGGAIATHLRVGNPLFSHTLFPIYVATMLWGGLWLRDLRVRALLPFTRR